MTSIKSTLDKQAKAKQRHYIINEVYPYLTPVELEVIYSFNQNPIAVNKYITRLIMSKSFKERKKAYVKKHA